MKTKQPTLAGVWKHIVMEKKYHLDTSQVKKNYYLFLKDSSIGYESFKQFKFITFLLKQRLN